jgi:hypothetical protein
VPVKALPATEYEYAAVPPVTAPRVITPLLFPQVEFVVVLAIAVGPGIFVTMGLTVKVQPLASLTVRV